MVGLSGWVRGKLTELYKETRAEPSDVPVIFIQIKNTSLHMLQSRIEFAKIFMCGTKWIDWYIWQQSLLDASGLHIQYDTYLLSVSCAPTQWGEMAWRQIWPSLQHKCRFKITSPLSLEFSSFQKLKFFLRLFWPCPWVQTVLVTCLHSSLSPSLIMFGQLKHYRGSGLVSGCVSTVSGSSLAPGSLDWHRSTCRSIGGGADFGRQHLKVETEV